MDRESFQSRDAPNDYEGLINRDKASLDIFWLRHESVGDPTISPIPTFSPRKSSKPSKPPWNNFAKSPLI
jgi:hypothetical protein